MFHLLHTSVIQWALLNLQPGRVVTLVPSDGLDDAVWGVAYKIKQEDIKQVTQHLDYREKNGYTRETVVFYPQDPELKPFSITLYIATEDNESYAGKLFYQNNKLFLRRRYSIAGLSMFLISSLVF